MANTVLVIDSNSAVQAMAALALNETDCVVEPITNPQQALAKIQQLKPIIIFCAKDLTGEDPYRLCREAKSINPRAAFVLLAPAEQMAKTKQNAGEAGCDEILFRPFKSNRLRETVQKFLTNFDPASPSNELSADDRLLSNDKPAATKAQKAKLDISEPLTLNYFKALTEELGIQQSEDSDADILITDQSERFNDSAIALKILISDDLLNSIEAPHSAIRPGTSEPAILKLLCSSREQQLSDLTPNQLCHLAGEVASGVYQMVLTNPAIKGRKWHIASTQLQRILLEATKKL